MSDDLVAQLLATLTAEQKQDLLEKIMNKMTEDTKDASSEEEAPKPVYKRNPPSEEAKDPNLFVMKNGPPKTKRQPVTEGKRFNKFQDSGTDHKDEANTTPNVELTERRRPGFKRVEQTCNRCSKSVEVHPQHVRDFFVCDSCLRR